jgi:hypothetical protein
MAATALLAAAVVATALATIRFTSGQRATSYAFAPQSYPSGLIVNRSWTLFGAHGDHLRGAVRLSNGGSAVLRSSYDEVIPKSVAASSDSVGTDPAPDRVVKADPVFRYQLDLAAGSTMRIGYDVQLSRTSGSWSSRLNALAEDQIQAQLDYLRATGQRPPTTLTILTIAAKVLTLSVGQTATIALSGKMSDGAPAPAAALVGVGWSSDDTAVATVTDGLVTAIGPGDTTVNAQAGPLSATVQITVGDRAKLAGTPPSSAIDAVSTSAGAGADPTPSGPDAGPSTPTVSSAPASSAGPGPSSSATVDTTAPTTSSPGPSTSPPLVRHPIATITSVAVSTPPPCPSAGGLTNCGITFSYTVGPSDVAITNINWWTDTAQNPQNAPNSFSCTSAPCPFNSPGLTPGSRGLSEFGSFTDTAQGGWLDVASGQPTCLWVTLSFADGVITTSRNSCTTW